MRSLFTALLGILFLSLLVSTVSAGFIVWPNWDEAAKYPDAIGDQTGLTVEDMTICYVTHDAEYIYFRAEFAGGGKLGRALLVYLDVDQNQATGDSGTDQDYGYDLHDLGAEWRLEVNTPSLKTIFKWNSGTNSWEGVASYNILDQDDTYIMFQVKLSYIENPQFPINILFISSEIGDHTDWNPNARHLEYPRVARPVGGILVPADKLALLSPYLALVGLLGAVTVVAAARRRKR